MKSQNKNQQNLFKFVQKDERIYDKKFETKPIGYFKDAMIRFAKNRVNVTASIILLTIFSLSIFVPIFTSKNFTNQIVELSLLPPRIPIVENLGILDGTRLFRDQVSSGVEIDEKTGLYLPDNFIKEYIELDTLTNEIVIGNLKDPSYRGGTNILQLDSNSSNVAVVSNKLYTLTAGDKIVVNIKNITNLNNEKFEIFLQDTLNKRILVSTITQSGITEVVIPSSVNFSLYKVVLNLSAGADDLRKLVEIESIKFNDNLNNLKFELSGYDLSIFNIVDGAGSLTRLNAQVIRTTFRYDVYPARLKQIVRTSIGSEVYNEIISENPEMLENAVPDPSNLNGLIFPEGSPLIKLISESSPIPGPDGEVFYSYIVEYELGKFFGYDDLPYFFFGTDVSGRDMFSLSWVGIRTSLLIGFLVSLINISIGIVFGAISGYYGGSVDLLMERFTEVIGRIPWLVTLAIFSSLFGPGIFTLVLILIISGWIGIAGVTRSQFYRYKGREYVLASRTLGAKDARLIFRHILPNGIGTIITASILLIPGVIFTESTIAYLGYGLGDGQVINLGFMQLSGTSLGVILNSGRASLDLYPYLTVFPAALVSILMITFNMFGNALRDAFNPSLRGVE
jgi:ABC-type dipeptide/oligopeptide/nickel transport system permease subunit